jgi:RES domain-containing protein
MRYGVGCEPVEIASLVRHISQDRTVRLVSSARLRDPVLRKLVDEDELDALAEIEGATSARLRTQEVGADHLDRRELVFGIPHAHLINASFSYWLPRNLNRFNGPGRGAWYAAHAVETCIAEVTFHMERELANVGDFNAVVEYAEMFASFVGDFVDVRNIDPRPDYLDPNPAKSYPAGNRLADAVRAAGHYGIVYPSVRARGGTCFVALVPHAVQSVAQGKVIRLLWKGTPGPEIEEIAS